METLLSNFLGAFFGFLFAIIIEIWVSRKSDKDIQNKIKTNIKNELEEIRDGLLKIKGNNENPLYFRYRFVAWETCINSGYLFSVSGKPIYNQFMDVYSEIVFANDIEEQYFDIEIKYSNSKNPKLTVNLIRELDKTRKEKRERILEFINEICGEHTG